MEDILPHRITETEFTAVIRRWRVMNNFVPTSKDVLEQLSIIRREAKAKQQLALAAAPEPVSDEYCENSKLQIASLLNKMNSGSPAKGMARQRRCKV